MRLTSYMVQNQAKALLSNLSKLQGNPNLQEAVVADLMEILCEFSSENGYESTNFSWKGVTNKLRDEGII